MGKNYKKNEKTKNPIYTPPKDGMMWISGYHSVVEKMKAGNPIREIYIQKNIRQEEVERMALEKGIPIKYLEKEEMDRYIPERHQGVIALAEEYTFVEVEDILELAAQKGEAPFVILLDHITDPHNVGAIIRTAHQVGCHGLIVTEKRAASLTDVVAKTSAGALEYFPVAQVTNLNQTIDLLKKKGLWIAGADMDGQEMYHADMTGAFGLVIGSEGEGISRLTREKCDFIVSIPMFGKIDSLNASVSAGVLLYEALRQRKYK